MRRIHQKGWTAMNSDRSHRLRLPLIILVNLLVLGINFAGCNTGGSTPRPAAITLCAVDSARAADFPSGACGTGAFVAQNSKAVLQVKAENKAGQPAANEQIHVRIQGANSAATTVTTNSSGQAQYSYAGAHLGTDTVTASPLGGGSGTTHSVTAIVHWIPSGGTIHPIVWVHGIHEDATDFAHELNGTPDADQAGDASEQTWSGLTGALTTTYNRNAMQAFCYVDDVAWTHSPSGCPTSETAQCNPTPLPSDCISQSSVDTNAVALAQVIQQLSQAFGNKPVTVIAYSMGGAIVRTLMAGCLNSASADKTSCMQAASLVNHVFLLNAAQEGSWLLAAKKGLDPSTLTGVGIPAIASSPFVAVLPLIESAVYARVKNQLGLDLNAGAELDLTPQSQNILEHNSTPPLAGADFYTFYGNIELGVETTYLIYTVPPHVLLPLGDLVMLAQADPATSIPLWGGSELCDGCSPIPAGANYHQSGRYHEWALTDQINIPMNGLAPLLSAPDAASSLQTALNSPVQHLNISQPAAQDPGSPIQVADITGLAGGAKTDMSYEIYLIIVHGDGLE